MVLRSPSTITTVKLGGYGSRKVMISSMLRMLIVVVVDGDDTIDDV